MNLKIFFAKILIVIIATLSITLFWRNTALTSVLLITCAVLINIKSSKTEVLSFVIVSILATLLEALANSTGAWTYSQTHILNFPIWLPLYWGLGGIVMKDLYVFLNKYILKST